MSSEGCLNDEDFLHQMSDNIFILFSYREQTPFSVEEKNRAANKNVHHSVDEVGKKGLKKGTKRQRVRVRVKSGNWKGTSRFTHDNDAPWLGHGQQNSKL